MPPVVRHLTPSGARSLLNGVKYIMLDIDGVVWAGDHVIDGVPETLRWLQDDLGISVRLMTNNSTKTRMDTVDKFHAKGMHWVHEDLVMSSAYASTVQLLKHGETTGDTVEISSSPSDGGGETVSSSSAKTRKKVYNRNVFVFGDKGLHKEIRRVLHPSKTTFGYELVPTTYLAQLAPTACTTATSSCAPEAHQLETAYTNFPYSPAVVMNALDQKVVPVGASSASSARTPLGYVAQMLSIRDMDVGAIVSGLDPNLNYHKVATAGLLLQLNKQAMLRAESEGGDTKSTSSQVVTRIPWIQTNPDPELPLNHPVADGHEMFFLPGAGTTEGLLARYLCRPPDKVCGKPHPDMAFALFEKIQSEMMGGDEIAPIDPSTEVLMVGDRVSTDITFGRRAGCKTMLVLSGCEGESHVVAADEADRPDFVADSLTSLMTMFKSEDL